MKKPRKNKRKPPIPPAREWVASAPKLRPGSPCWLCQNPEAAAWASEAYRHGASQSLVTDGLRKFFGYPRVGARTAGTHIREHGGRS